MRVELGQDDAGHDHLHGRQANAIGRHGVEDDLGERSSVVLGAELVLGVLGSGGVGVHRYCTLYWVARA